MTTTKSIRALSVAGATSTPSAVVIPTLGFTTLSLQTSVVENGTSLVDPVITWSNDGVTYAQAESGADAISQMDPPETTIGTFTVKGAYAKITYTISGASPDVDIESTVALW